MQNPAFAYHPDTPDGRIFDLANEDHRNQIDVEGWVDTPAKLENWGKEYAPKKPAAKKPAAKKT